MPNFLTARRESFLRQHKLEKMRTIGICARGVKGLLSPALSSNGGEGEETAGSLDKSLNSMAATEGLIDARHFNETEVV